MKPSKKMISIERCTQESLNEVTTMICASRIGSSRL